MWLGKKEIHTEKGSNNMWGIVEEEFMERMTESTKSVIDHFAPGICFVNIIGNDRYHLIDIDNNDEEITAGEAVQGVKPVWKPDKYNVFWGRNKH